VKIVKETGVNLIFGKALVGIAGGWNSVHHTDIYFINMNVMQHPKTDQSGFEQNMLTVELTVVLSK